MSVLYRALRRLSEEEDKAHPADDLSEILAEPPPRRRLIRPGFAAGAVVLVVAAVVISQRFAGVTAPSAPTAVPPQEAPRQVALAQAVPPSKPADAPADTPQKAPAASSSVPPPMAAPAMASASPAPLPEKRSAATVADAPVAAKKPPIVVAEATPAPAPTPPQAKISPESGISGGHADAASGDDAPPPSAKPTRMPVAAASAAAQAGTGAGGRGKAASAQLVAADAADDEDFTPAAKPPARTGAPAAPAAGAMIEIHRDDDATRDDIQKGNTLLLRGDYPGALAVYQRVVAAHRDNVEGAVGVAVALHKMQRLDEAAKAYRRALDLEPGNVSALGGMLTILTQTEPSSALPQLLDLAQDHPYNAPLLAQLANAYAETGANDSALRWMREAVRLSPDNPYYRLNLAVLLDRSNNGDDAAAEYQNYLRLVTMSGDVAANRDEITRVNTRLNYLRAASLKP